MTSNATKKFVLVGSAAMENFGCKLASRCSSGLVIYLQGELGAGKTTLARGFIRQLGYQGQVRSPTFTILESYNLKQHTVLHLDLYRIKTPDELAYIGISEYLSDTSLCLIEWPQLGVGFIPEPDLLCTIDFVPSGTSREVTLQAVNARGSDLINQL